MRVAVVLACLALLGRDDASAKDSCRRSCRAGETRDASGCCRKSRRRRAVNLDKITESKSANTACLTGQTCLAECAKGTGESCRRMARLIEGGWSMHPDDRAARLYQKACDAGDVPACLRVSSSWDPLKRLALALKACKAGIADGCTLVGSAYMSGDGVPKDEQKAQTANQAALAAGEAACKAGDPDGCYLRYFISNLNETNYEDWEIVRKAYMTRCQAGDTLACFGGLGVSADIQGLCTAGNGPACIAVGSSLLGSDPQRTAELFLLAYVAGSVDAAYLVGELYESGTGMSADSNRAAELYREACNKGSADGCGRLTTDDDLKVACAGGAPEGCMRLGDDRLTRDWYAAAWDWGAGDDAKQAAELDGFAECIVDNPVIAGQLVPVKLQVGLGIQATAVTLHYRAAGATTYDSWPMTRTHGVFWRASIATNAPVELQLYLTATGQDGTEYTACSSEAEPYTVEVKAP